MTGGGQDSSGSASAAVVCAFCGLQFSFQGHLEQHVNRFHPERVAFSPAFLQNARATCGTPARPPPGAFQASTGDGEPCSTPDVHLPDGDVRNLLDKSVPVSPRRDLPTRSALVRQYVLDKKDMEQTRPFVPSSKLIRPSAFVTPELKEMRMMALSSGGHGMSASGRRKLYLSMLHTEQACIRSFQRHLEQASDSDGTEDDAGSRASAGVGAGAGTGEGTGVSEVADRRAGVEQPKSRRRNRTVKHTSVRQRERQRRADGAAPKRQRFCGPLESAFPNADAFVKSLKGEQDRCLAEQQWRMTDIVEEGRSYPFVSRCVVEVARDVFSTSEEVCLEGKATGVRTGTLDSDLYLAEQADVKALHDLKKEYRGKMLRAFTLAVQFFSDSAVVSENGGTSVVLRPDSWRGIGRLDSVSVASDASRRSLLTFC